MDKKRCCFIGHRRIENPEKLKEKLFIIIENLIIKESVTEFVFGSRSKFDDLCHMVVTEIKKEKNYIERIQVTTKSEYCVLESEREKVERVTNLRHKGYERGIDANDGEDVGITAYIKRNYQMIDLSDYAIFYYNENYLPKTGSKSGTGYAYKYAIKRKRQNKLHSVINLYV